MASRKSHGSPCSRNFGAAPGNRCARRLSEPVLGSQDVHGPVLHSIHLIDEF
jgi:hypothetical protein